MRRRANKRITVFWSTPGRAVGHGCLAFVHSKIPQLGSFAIAGLLKTCGSIASENLFDLKIQCLYLMGMFPIEGGKQFASFYNHHVGAQHINDVSLVLFIFQRHKLLPSQCLARLLHRRVVQRCCVFLFLLPFSFAVDANCS